MEGMGIVEPLLLWYGKNKRDLPWRHNCTPYRVWVSEIMLQQTRVEAVKNYFVRFLQAAPDIPSLADLPEEKLLKLWEGLGYYSRVRNLQKAAKLLVSRYGGQMPASYAQLLELPGVGSYTAGAVASIAFGLPCPAVDGNVLRVWMRLTADGADIADPHTKRQTEAALRPLMPVGRCGDFTQALIELGALVCVPNATPKCAVCPLADFCKAHRQKEEQCYPVKKPKPPRRVEQRTILLLEQAGRIALRKRPAKGLLASLWELPGFDGTLSQEQAIAAVRSLGLEPVRLQPLAPAKHIFTHVEWHMTGWQVQLAPLPDTHRLVWATEQELRERYSLPSAFRPFLQKFLQT